MEPLCTKEMISIFTNVKFPTNFIKNICKFSGKYPEFVHVIEPSADQLLVRHAKKLLWIAEDDS
jgi:hypothetical protein